MRRRGQVRSKLFGKNSVGPTVPFKVSRLTHDSQTRAELISVENIHNIFRPLGVGVRLDWGGHQGTLRVMVVFSHVWGCTQMHALVKRKHRVH